jgi:YfiH family protein
MIFTEHSGVPVFRFAHLETYPEIRHGIFTRKGGCSKEPFGSLNVGLHVGDDEANVKFNRKKVSQNIGVNDVVYAEQTHGTEVLIFSKSQQDSPVKASFKGDAMVTDIQNKILAIQVADCQAVLMYDPFKKVVANVHSGWRGSIHNIVGRTVKAMKTCFGCNPSDIIAGISPSLGPCCAEFVNYKHEIPEKFWIYKTGADHFDFWRMTCDQLCDTGVLQKNIYSSNICTRCNTDSFYSFRKHRITGRFAAVIGLI